jgi:hypothetical protein
MFCADGHFRAGGFHQSTTVKPRPRATRFRAVEVGVRTSHMRIKLWAVGCTRNGVHTALSVIEKRQRCLVYHPENARRGQRLGSFAPGRLISRPASPCCAKITIPSRFHLAESVLQFIRRPPMPAPRAAPRIVAASTPRAVERGTSALGQVHGAEISVAARQFAAPCRLNDENPRGKC